jgi:hypothetical protein
MNHCKHIYNEKRSKAEKRRQSVPHIAYEFMLVEECGWLGGVVDSYLDSEKVPISIGRHFPDIPQFG